MPTTNETGPEDVPSSNFTEEKYNPDPYEEPPPSGANEGYKDNEDLDFDE